MKKILLHATVAALFFLSARAVEIDKGVLVLTDQNFHQEVKKYEKILVQFYAPWCGHCKNLAPEYQIAAKELKQSQNPVPLAKVDATAQKKLADQYGIKSFPTLKWLTNYGAKKQDYGGGRTKDEIVAWINKKTGPVSKKLQSSQDLENFKAGKKVAVVFMGQEDSNEYNVFIKAASDYEKIQFAHYSCTAECQSAFNTEGAKLVLFKIFDNKQDNFAGSFQVENIKSFIDKNSVPKVFEFGDSYVEDIFGKSRSTLFLFSDKNSSTYPQYLNMMKNAYNKDNRILYSLSDAQGGIQQKLAEFVGIKLDQLPIVVLLEFAGDKMNKYRMGGEINDTNIQNFVSDFFSNNLEIFLKTQDVPDQEFDKGVKVLVGKNFKQQVFDSGKDYFVKFYAPWCGHCKSLAPKWQEIAKQVNIDGSKVVIAKLDSTENEVKGVNITAFPTLHFYKAGSREPVVYSGEREKKDLVSFLKEHTTLPSSAQTDL